MPELLSPAGAPPTLGPYSPGLRVGNMIFLSGSIPMDPATGQMRTGDIAEQATQALDNVRALLESAGATLGQVVKTTVFLADMNEFAAMNEVYATYFSKPYPARSTVQVARLPKDCKVEIEVIAVLD